MEEEPPPPGLSTAQSSSLPSLTPSPESVSSNERPSKRPRLSSTSPLPPRLSHTSSPRTIVKSDQLEDLDALLYGLDEEDLMMPPSSDPVVRGEDADVEEEDDDDPGGLAVPRRRNRKEPWPEGVQAGRGRADDSGIGLLPSDDEHSGDLVKANATFLPMPEVDDAEEFEGDDLWLGFDDSDMGFDDPDTFSSLSASLAGPIRASITLDTVKGKAVEAPKEEEEDPHENEPAPALESFGFANLNSHGSFVFATRKPFAASEAALQRARAILEADDDLPATATSDFGSVGSSTPLPRSVPLRPSFAPPAFIPLSRPSAANAPNSRTRSMPRFDPLLATRNPVSRPVAFAPPPSAFAPSSHTGVQPPLLQQGSSSPLHIPQPVHVTAPQPFIGFLNAAGRTLDMPTEEALRRARQRFERSSSPPGPPASEQLHQNGSNRPLRPPSSIGLKDVFESAPHPPSRVAGTSSFALPPIAKAADARHDLPMTDGFGLRGGLFDSPTVVRTLPRGEGNEASPGKKTPLLPVENVKSSAEKEGRLSDKTSPPTLVSSSPERSSSPPPLSPIPRSTVTAPQVAPPQTEQLANATSHPIAAFASPRPPSPHLPRPSPAGPSRPSFAALPTPRTHGFRSPLITTASALRNPSRPPASTPLRITATPSPAFPVSSTPVPLPRRLNLGMTPRNKPFHLANTQFQMSTNGKGKAKGFVTPFKGGKRPEGLTPMGLKGKPGAPAAAAEARGAMPGGASTHKSKAAAKGSEKVVTRNRPKLFDLDTAAAGRRFDLVNFGLRPQTHYYEYLQSLGFPDRLISMDSTSSADYVFSCGRSSQDAFLALQSLVVSRSPDEKDLVTLPWVKNHWSLVVWKLACYVRSRPDLRDGWWRFEMVLEQLRYRYEREINLAHRSAIKRIQEQDSPASLPMVLCVSQIRWDDSSEEFGEADTPLTIVGLELTDGWYRIRTNVDATLKSACERGKIVLGAKIAVMGAKLENSRGEGIDVLQALGRSSLVISGNSTSLAPWHAKLGFCRERFVAGFESLTSGGGLVPLVDIVVDKIYPCGYMDLRRGRSSETWGEEEELTREEEWRRGRERIQAKLADDAEKDGDEENELVELLQEAVLEVGPLPPSPPGFTSDSAEEPEEILDRLEASASKASIIRKMSARQLHACLALAVENARNSRMSGFQELQQELAEKYPPREVRSFRLIRVRDARQGDKSTGREALLTVWDAQAFEPDFFREGRRYLVTNLVPKGNWQRKHKEIALVTRRDSKWSRVQHDGAGRQAYIASQ